MEQNHNMDKRVTRFMLPMGATMNMDGAALYEAVSVLFISQIHNMDFNFGQIIALRYFVFKLDYVTLVCHLQMHVISGLDRKNISIGT